MVGQLAVPGVINSVSVTILRELWLPCHPETEAEAVASLNCCACKLFPPRRPRAHPAEALHRSNGAGSIPWEHFVQGLSALQLSLHLGLVLDGQSAPPQPCLACADRPVSDNSGTNSFRPYPRSSRARHRRCVPAHCRCDVLCELSIFSSCVVASPTTTSPHVCPWLFAFPCLHRLPPGTELTTLRPRDLVSQGLRSLSCSAVTKLLLLCNPVCAPGRRCQPALDDVF